MVSEREREIRERVDKATAGPWTPGRDDMQSYDGHTGEAFTNVYADNPKGKFHLGERLPLVVARAFDESGRNKADAAFIAHAREDVPWLLDALTTEREARVAAEGELAREKSNHAANWSLLQAAYKDRDERILPLLDKTKHELDAVEGERKRLEDIVLSHQAEQKRLETAFDRLTVKYTERGKVNASLNKRLQQAERQALQPARPEGE